MNETRTRHPTTNRTLSWRMRTRVPMNPRRKIFAKINKQKIIRAKTQLCGSKWVVLVTCVAAEKLLGSPISRRGRHKSHRYILLQCTVRVIRECASGLVSPRSLPGCFFGRQVVPKKVTTAALWAAFKRYCEASLDARNAALLHDADVVVTEYVCMTDFIKSKMQYDLGDFHRYSLWE
eukprot:5116866-Amphidinium_carterae.1